MKKTPASTPLLAGTSTVAAGHASAKISKDVASASSADGPKRIDCGLCILVDSREQNPYTFESIYANRDRHNALLHVPTMRIGLPTGDYGLLGYPQIRLERKTKEDLFGSVVRRANFEDRLARMSELTYSAVVVEAERMDCIARPPAFTKFSPKALSRTLIAWDVRYPVKWHFMPGREAAEILTYRILEAFFKQHRDELITGND